MFLRMSLVCALASAAHSPGVLRLAMFGPRASAPGAHDGVARPSPRRMAALCAQRRDIAL